MKGGFGDNYYYQMVDLIRSYKGVHWEMDTVVGKQGTKTVLLVLSERVTRKVLIFKIPSKSQAAVVNVLDMLERKMGKLQFR